LSDWIKLLYGCKYETKDVICDKVTRKWWFWKKHDDIKVAPEIKIKDIFSSKSKPPTTGGAPLIHYQN